MEVRQAEERREKLAGLRQVEPQQHVHAKAEERALAQPLDRPRGAPHRGGHRVGLRLGGRAGAGACVRAGGMFVLVRVCV